MLRLTSAPEGPPAARRSRITQSTSASGVASTQPAAPKAKAKAKAKDAFLDQIERRLATMEHETHSELMIPQAGTLAQAGQEAGRQYEESRKAGVTVGVPHLHVAAAIIDVLCGEYSDKAANLDTAAKKRWEVLMDIQACIARLSQEDLDEFIKTFTVDPMRQVEGKSQTARLTFCLVGAASLGDDQGIDERLVTARAADPKDRYLATFRFVEMQIVPRSGTGSAVGLQGLLRAVLCSAGATRWTGRKPRGGLAWRNRKGE